MLMLSPRLKVTKIAKDIGITDRRAFNILTAELRMKKLFARWVPRILTIDQKCQIMRNAEQSLDDFNANKTDSVRRFVTKDKTWVHYYTLETKQQ